MDQHLQWDSNHSISAKNSIFNTFAHRARVVCTDQSTLQQENDEIRKALSACKFPPWALNSLQLKFNYKHNINNTHTTSNGQHNNTNNIASSNKNIFTVVPYIRGFSGKLKKACNRLGIQVHFKRNNTIWTLLMAPKDKDEMCLKIEVIYQYKCSHTNCSEQYIGESGRTFGGKFREHLRTLSPIHQYSQSTGHSMDLESFTIIDRDAQGATRTIKEAMYI